MKGAGHSLDRLIDLLFCLVRDLKTEFRMHNLTGAGPAGDRNGMDKGLAFRYLPGKLIPEILMHDTQGMEDRFILELPHKFLG